jgi:hypothetical protein
MTRMPPTQSAALVCDPRLNEVPGLISSEP